MLKLYITAIDSRPDGSAVTIFEDYLVKIQDVDELRLYERLSTQIAEKIEDIELINEQASSPL